MVLTYLPINDVVEHVRSDACVCGPTSELVDCATGGTGWLVVHHSLDGREADEQDGVDQGRG